MTPEKVQQFLRSIMDNIPVAMASVWQRSRPLSSNMAAGYRWRVNWQKDPYSRYSCPNRKRRPLEKILKQPERLDFETLQHRGGLSCRLFLLAVRGNREHHDLSSEADKPVYCAVDFMGRKRLLLEAQRTEL
jgi:hypothetical protein